MAKVDWILGSRKHAENMTLVFNGGNHVIASGYWYAHHPGSSSYSMTNKMAALVTGSCYFDKAGYMHVSASGNWTLNFNSNTNWMQAMGATGTITTNGDFRMPKLSNICWFPRQPAIPKAKAGKIGVQVDDTIVQSSPSGLTSVARRHFNRLEQTLTWNKLYVARVWDDDETPGTLYPFMQNVLRKNYPFFDFQQIEEDVNDSTTEVTFTTRLGAYKMKNIRDLDNWYQREIQNNDIYVSFTINLLRTNDIPAA